VGSWHRDIEDDHEGKGIRDYTRTSKTPLRRVDLEESGETTEGGEEDTWGGVGVGTVVGGGGSGSRGGGDGGSGSAGQHSQKEIKKTYPEVMDRAEEAELPTAPEAEPTAELAEETLEATAEDAEETEAPTPAAEEVMEATEDPAAEETEAEAPPEVTPAAPAAEVAEAFKQSVEEPAWMVTGEE
jgi:hypothetical protein